MQLKKHNIAFIEQITNARQTHTLNWTQVKVNAGSKYIGRHPKWYTELIKIIATPDKINNCWKINIQGLLTNEIIRCRSTMNQPIEREQYMATKINQQIIIGKRTKKVRSG